jgi:hypothetical protein
MDELERTLETTELVPEAHQEQLEKLLSLIRQMPAKGERRERSTSVLSGLAPTSIA